LVELRCPLIPWSIGSKCLQLNEMNKHQRQSALQDHHPFIQDLTTFFAGLRARQSGFWIAICRSATDASTLLRIHRVPV
jgi:hypothetical protein